MSELKSGPSRELENLNRLVAEALGKPQRIIPSGHKEIGDCLKQDSVFWRNTVQRAIDAGVKMNQCGAYKGINYSAIFNGWLISEQLNYADAYKAPDSILIDETPEAWLEGISGSGLSIKPSPILPYSTDADLALRALEEFCDQKEYGYEVTRSVSRKFPSYDVYILLSNTLYVHGRDQKSLPLAICRAIIETVGKEKKGEEKHG